MAEREWAHLWSVIGAACIGAAWGCAVQQQPRSLIGTIATIVVWRITVEKLSV